ncbi:12S rRNA N(4)-cytidine methyltransferase METTL15 isoform X2 [Rhinolophus sinicus]|uniref:12S rRNA N(4)-cytidine methyltransferase METTL15 isoform X2 n=1 Tax=Rhinolophus sinicus TaxID=89399 RepID=UPI003D7A0D12
MLRYPYFCRTYKEFLSCWLESGMFNLGVWPKKIHATAERYDEYEAHEQTDQTVAQEFRRSQDAEVMTKLHIPVMVDEVVRCLAPQKGQIFLDMTFGSGGHSRAILQKESDITLYALDRDPTAYAMAEQLSELYPKQIRALLGQFSQAEALLMRAGVQPGTLDGVLLDLGCSSMQLDAAERGFSLRKDGPLDMRMDGGRYPDMPTAADVVNALDQQSLASILRTYGEEKHAKKIASAVVQARSVYPITRTQQLASIVAEFWRLKVQNQGFPQCSQEECFLDYSWCLVVVCDPRRFLACSCITKGSASIITWFSPCASVFEFKCPLVIRTPVILDLGATLLQYVLNF